MTKNKVAGSVFPVSFDYITRDPKARPINNILDKKRAKYAQSTIVDLVNKVDTGSNVAFMSAKERYQKLSTIFDPANFPTYAMVPLGLLASDEDIQRELDVPHATNIFAYFDEQRVQAIQCVKTPGKDEYTMVNGQHTATGIALIVSSGFMTGWKAKDWKKFPVQISYIETLDRSKARETFALLNGEMSKDISLFDHWKQHCLSVWLDGSGNPKYLHTAKLVDIMQKYNCIPLPEGHSDSGLAGSVTHLAAVETAAKNGNYDKVHFIFSNHDKFWNALNVDNTEFGFYGSLFDITEEENILRNTKEWNEFMVDLHAVVQKVFYGMAKLKSSTTKAYKNYRYDQFLDKNASVPFNVALYVAYKVYKKLGGTFDIEPLNNMYVHKNIDVMHYLTSGEIDFINSFIPARTRVKSKAVIRPKRTTKKV